MSASACLAVSDTHQPEAYVLFVPLLDLQLVGTSPELHGRLNCICKVHMYKDPTCKDPKDPNPSLYIFVLRDWKIVTRRFVNVLAPDY